MTLTLFILFWNQFDNLLAIPRGCQGGLLVFEIELTISWLKSLGWLVDFHTCSYDQLYFDHSFLGIDEIFCLESFGLNFCS